VISDATHRLLTGQALTRSELIGGGIFVLGWFVMDFVQWFDWLTLKLWPVAVVCVTLLQPLNTQHRRRFWRRLFLMFRHQFRGFGGGAREHGAVHS
jgi:hypothetical protein